MMLRPVLRYSPAIFLSDDYECYTRAKADVTDRADMRMAAGPPAIVTSAGAVPL